MIKKIISGGQTGVDRAALDVALELGIPCGGWCPKGRLAEDGPIDLRYPLQEVGSTSYSVRTERNVMEADGTLILTEGPLTGGTALTLTLAQKNGEPHLVIDLSKDQDIAEIMSWVTSNEIEVLNVAGPRPRGTRTIPSWFCGTRSGRLCRKTAGRARNSAWRSGARSAGPGF